jgi:2-iminobutanoate/2-iminopropanoate deaminase
VAGEDDKRSIGEKMLKQIVRSSAAPEAIGPYSQAVRSSDIVFCSGQLPADVTNGKIPDGISAQTRMVLRNLSEVLKSSGSSLSAVLKTTVFMIDLEQFELMNQVYREFFREDAPARSTVQVTKLPKGALIEIEAVAVANGG